MAIVMTAFSYIFIYFIEILLQFVSDDQIGNGLWLI